MFKLQQEPDGPMIQSVRVVTVFIGNKKNGNGRQDWSDLREMTLAYGLNDFVSYITRSNYMRRVSHEYSTPKLKIGTGVLEDTAIVLLDQQNNLFFGPTNPVLESDIKDAITNAINVQNVSPPTPNTMYLCFLATEDRLASPQAQRKMADHFSTIRLLEIPTWHLNCSAVLGPSYAPAIRNFSEDVLDPANQAEPLSKR